MRKRYFLMVCSLKESSCATSRLLRPSATRATTCSSRGVSKRIPREFRSGTRSHTASARCWPKLARMHALDALAKQPKRVLGEAEQATRAGAEGVDHDVAVVSGEQDNFGHLGMSQVQAARHRHVRPAVLGAVGI